MSETTTTIAHAREIVTLAVQNLPGVTVGSGSDGQKRMDYAIMAAGNEFCRRTMAVVGQGTKVATPDDDDLDTSTITDMFASRIFQVTATEPTSLEVYPVQLSDYQDVQLELTKRDQFLQFPFVNLSDFQYRPLKIAFRDETNAKIWPTPDVAWTYTFDYWVKFTTYTAGTATDSTVLNIPDDMIHGVLFYGAAAFFEQANPANQYIGSARANFERHISQCRGRTSPTRVVNANEWNYS